jgi:glycosyltransferase involved in cell wall biosynthesis
VEERVLEYVAPWTRGRRGVVATNLSEYEGPVDFDLVSFSGSAPTPLDKDDDRTYPWALATMVGSATDVPALLRWLIRRVEKTGVLMIELPYPKFKPSDVLRMLRMALLDLWVITSELKNGSTIVVVKLKHPDKQDAVGFYINNRTEVGDTMSLIPLCHELRREWPNCVIWVKEDPHGLLEGKALVSKEMNMASDGVLHQYTHRYEYGDYWRRTDDFYAYPIHLACNLGWLKDTECPEYPEVPAIEGEYRDTVRTRMKKARDGYIVVAPQTNFAPRDWSDARWIRVIRWLVEHDNRVVVVGRNRMTVDVGPHHQKVINLAGFTNVKELGTIIKGATLLVGCDSSPVHMAMGHKVRAIVLQGPTAEAPLFRYDQVVSVHRKTGCVNCYQRVGDDVPYIEGEQPSLYPECNANAGNTTCMDKISVMQVIDTLREELGYDRDPPGLSVCMMVKNEDKLLAEALFTADAAADEIIILDTGSTDTTKDLVRAFGCDRGDKVKFIEHDGVGFEDGKICDFSAVRNAAFGHATQKYVMWMDAGDRITDPQRLREIVLAEESDMIHMPTVFGGARYLRERVVPRIFAEFKDRVHETMQIGGLLSRTVNVDMKHVGSKKVGREQSLERNTRLLKRMLKEQPKSNGRFRWMYYLARDLKQSGKSDEALHYFGAVRDGQGFWEERAHAAVEIGRIFRDKQQYQASLMAGLDALKHCDGWRDPYYIVGDAYYWMGEYEKALGWFKHCLMIPRPNTVLWLWEDLYTWLPVCQISYCLEKLGSIDGALHAVMDERSMAPASQHKRIDDRIDELKRKLQ